MTGWQPDIDLQRLLSALGEELCAATDDEVREVCGTAGQSMAGAARAIRKRIAAASGGQDEPDPGLLPVDGVRCGEQCWRHN